MAIWSVPVTWKQWLVSEPRRAIVDCHSCVGFQVAASIFATTDDDRDECTYAEFVNVSALPCVIS